jgi:hypothetical protein
MKTQVTGLLNFFGVIIQGDFADITCYRSKNGTLIWFPKAPPRKPPSELQIDQRDKWSDIIENWVELPQATRDKWELVCQRESLWISGINLYIWWRCSLDDSIIHTLERHTGITLIS